MLGLENVKDILLVLSGKGGVGKSSVSVQLAISLALAGKKVGLLDVDLCGPSIPRMLNVSDSRITQGVSGWIPVKLSFENYCISVMSIAFLLPNKDDAVVWRGPKKTCTL
jgi:Mrp family chromosome partitioning ATPase